MKITKLALALAAAALTAAPAGVLNAADAPSEELLQKQMKEAGKIMRNFKKGADAKDAGKVSADAARLSELFAETCKFWAAKNVDDAVKWSKESAAAAKAASAAAKAGDWAKEGASMKTVGGNCRSCHEAHREKLPDNSFKIK